MRHFLVLCLSAVFLNALPRVSEGNRAVAQKTTEPRESYNTITVLAVSPDGKRLFTVTNSRHGDFWDIERGLDDNHLPRPDPGPRASSAFEPCAFSPEGKFLYGVDSAGAVVERDINAGKTLRTFADAEPKKQQARALTIARTGARIVTLHGNLHLKVWDIESGKCVKVLKDDREDLLRYYLGRMALSDDGKHALLSDRLGHLVEWDLDAGKVVQTLKPETLRFPSGSTSGVSDLLYAPGRKAITAPGVGGIHVWDLDKGELVRTIDERKDGEGYYTSIALSKDGTVLAGGARRGAEVTVSLWDWRSGRRLETLPD